MRKYLLPEKGQFFKANLHCHSTVSDGRRTPEEIVELYRRHGYSIVAFTDHNKEVPHPELRRDDFLPLTGFEFNFNAPGYPEKDKKACHLCFVSPKDPTSPGADLDVKKPDYDRTYSPEAINEAIRLGRESGYFVTYNHPCWSLEDYGDYMNYHGMNAMEILNYGCYTIGFPDYNSRVYDDMLRGGERLFCIAADDNHNKHPDDDPLSDSCGGWVMIKADALEYGAVLDALKNGDFYSSMGPEIHALWFEDGKVHVECSPAVKVNLINSIRSAKSVAAKDASVTSAEFSILPECKWFRIDVVDERGNHADTNAFFVDALALPAETGK